ncbi:MAG TPA: hypothetical protein VGN57_20305 [Pirellulaceae bacterium]|jgi:hypothetical protein|nr:hypothetical protein [Pirellulaceae bacterium]
MSIFGKWNGAIGRAAAGLALLASPLLAYGQNEQAVKPLAVVAVAPTNRLLGADDDSAGAIGYLTKQLGHPDWGMMAKFLSAGYLKQLDQSKPWGIYVLPNMEEPAAVAFLPIADVEKVFNTLEGQIPEPVKGEDGVYSVEMQGQTVYAKSSDGWTYVSNSLSAFDNLIPQPETLIADLSKDYLVAAEFRMQALPEDTKQMLLGQVKEGVEAGLESQEDPAAREASRQYGDAIVDSINQFFEEGDSIILGWGVDEQQGNTFLDMSFTAVEGSEYQKQLAASFGDDVKSPFSGFVEEGAAVTLVGVGKMTDDEKAQTKLMLGEFARQFDKEIDNDEDFEDEASREKVKAIMQDIVASVEKTIDQGVTSIAGSMILGESELNVIGAAKIADGQNLSASLDQLIDLSRQRGELEENDVTVEKTAEDGITYHVITAPVPEGNEDARELFGDKVTVVLAFQDDAAYAAFGTSAQEMLDAAISVSKAAGEVEVPSLQMTISLGRILRFAADQQEDDNLSAIAQSLQASNGRDNILLTREPIANGARVRILAEDGVLAAIGQAIDLYTAGGDDSDF